MHGGKRRTWSAVVLVVAAAFGLLAPAPRAEAAGEHEPDIRTFELPSPLVDTSSPGGRLDRRAVPTIHVLLPEGYDAHPDRRYPVLWFLHGANGGSNSTLRGVAPLAKDFPGIIVMPDGGLFGMYTDWWNGGARDGPAWATYHLQVLRREIEQRFRIRPERRWHAIAGISMGGQGALRYAAMLPGYFGSVAGFSAATPDIQSPITEGGLGLITAASSAGGGATYEAIWGRSDGAYAQGNSPQALAANFGNTRIFVTSGIGTNCAQDPVNPNSILLDTITEAGLHLLQAPFVVATRAAGADVTSESTCGVHTFGVWDRAFARAERWGFFADVPEHPERWRYRTIATTGEMWNLRFRFTEPPAVVADFTRAGSTLSATGRGQVVIDGPPGCAFTAELPFERALSAACSP